MAETPNQQEHPAGRRSPSRPALLTGAAAGVALGLLNWFVLLPAVSGDDEAVRPATSSVAVAGTVGSPPPGGPAPAEPPAVASAPGPSAVVPAEPAPAPAPPPENRAPRDPFSVPGSGPAAG